MLSSPADDSASTMRSSPRLNFNEIEELWESSVHACLLKQSGKAESLGIFPFIGKSLLFHFFLVNKFLSLVGAAVLVPESARERTLEIFPQLPSTHFPISTALCSCDCVLHILSYYCDENENRSQRHKFPQLQTFCFFLDWVKEKLSQPSSWLDFTVGFSRLFTRSRLTNSER